jgi:hypothetical protein
MPIVRVREEEEEEAKWNQLRSFFLLEAEKDNNDGNTGSICKWPQVRRLWRWDSRCDWYVSLGWAAR